jgi:hypothetical protein
MLIVSVIVIVSALATQITVAIAVILSILNVVDPHCLLFSLALHLLSSL